MGAPNVSIKPLPPIVKWLGGKRWLVPVLRRIYDRHRGRRLVEPFAGGLSVALGLLPERALLNDLNPHLINLYLWIKRGLGSPSNKKKEEGDRRPATQFPTPSHQILYQEGEEGLEFSLPLIYDQETYYRYRDRFNQLIREGKHNTKEAAGLFYYLNKTGYNGLCRFNSRGEYNVPFGSYKKVSFIKDFSPYREVFQNWEFTNLDFRQVEYLPDDFIYADPPYDVEFTRYTPEGFSLKDHIDLAKMLSSHPGPVVISNQATKRIVELYQDLGFSLRFLKGPRRVSRNGDRTPADEVLAYKNL